MKSVFIIWLVLNGGASLAGFMWTSMDRNSRPENKTVPGIDWGMPAPYIFPGFVVGHYLSKFMFTSFK